VSELNVEDIESISTLKKPTFSIVKKQLLNVGSYVVCPNERHYVSITRATTFRLLPVLVPDCHRLLDWPQKKALPLPHNSHID